MQAMGLGRGALAAVLASALGLSGCGGGGGGAGNTESYGTLAAWNHLYGAHHAWSLYATDGTNNFQLNLTTDPLAAAVFPGTGDSGTRQLLTGDSYKNGALLGTSSSTYYLNANNELAGQADSDGTCYIPGATSALPPTAAKVGNSGPLGTWSVFDSCVANATQTGTGVESWQVEQVNGIVYFCQVSQFAYLNRTSDVQKRCVEMDTAGVIKAAAYISDLQTASDGTQSLATYATR